MRNKGKARRIALKMARALRWEESDLMQHKHGIQPSVMPLSFVFKAEDCPRGTAEVLWPGVFSCHNARDQREALLRAT